MIGAALGSAVIGASSASKATKAQTSAANNQLALEGRIYDETTARFEPAYQAGLDYNNALRYELLGGDIPTFGGDPQKVNEYTSSTTQPNPLYNAINPYANSRSGEANPQNLTTTTTRYGVGGEMFDTRDAAQQYADNNPTGGYEYQGFQATPGYQFAVDQGLGAIDASAASRGGLFSGATLQASQKFGTGLANQEYNTYLNRLTSGAASGQAAAGNMANAGANYAQGAGQAYGNIGNAQAAGAIGVGNALTGGVNNAIGLWNYQNMQGGGGNRLFGGNSWG